MSEENVEVVRRGFELLNRDGPEAALAVLGPEVEWHDLPDQPDAEVHRGHAGFLAAMEQFFGEMEDFSVNPDEIIDHGEQVVGCIRVIGRGRSSGARFEQRAAAVWTLRNGFIVRVVWFGTREDALAAVGLPE